MKLKKLETVRVGARSVGEYVQAVKNGRAIMPSKISPKDSLKKSTKIFINQEEALNFARKVALKYQSELSINGGNGRIKKKFIDGEYSFPPRG